MAMPSAYSGVVLALFFGGVLWWWWWCKLGAFLNVYELG
ncbi:hypothetical protein A2U01_0030124, partial [Trifolium medium]|nr:hypothetical protein [Trifolium medium]